MGRPTNTDHVGRGIRDPGSYLDFVVQSRRRNKPPSKHLLDDTFQVVPYFPEEYFKGIRLECNGQEEGGYDC